MLDGFGGDHRCDASASVRHDVECFHVNVRLSKRLEDIGDLRLGKFVLLILYCFQAIWCRFRYGVDNFYYVPAPGKTSALVRDWMVMLLCRPFFKQFILHWHAAGLAKWLETCTQMRSRSFTFALMKNADMSIVLSRYNRADAEKLFPKRIAVVNNGIPDPCPAYGRDVLPRRKARLEARRRLLAGETLTSDDRASVGDDPHIVQVLYLAHCTRQKGAFDAMAGVALANKKLAELNAPVTLRLTVTGSFVTAEDRAEFEALIQKPEVAGCVHYAGFVSGEQKEKLLRNADIFCFPTFYPNENQPVNLIEAMAYGLPVLTTHWRSLPEIFPNDYPGLVDVRSLPQIADALLRLMSEDGEALRDLFLKNFTIEKYLSGLSNAFHKARQDSAQGAPAPVPTT
jgi:glycosyltransferase involved in cell wall biosynthesis